MMHLAKKAVFFDLGGTLLIMRRDRVFRSLLEEEGYSATVESVHGAYAEAESSWLRRYGYRKLSPVRSVESYRRFDARAFRQLFPGASAGEAKRISKLMREKWPELQARFQPRLYPDANPTLERLSRRGYRLGLVTNAPPDAPDVIRRLGLDRYTSNFAVSGVVGFSKPSPEIFEVALRGAMVSPSDAVHVGDVYEADVVGARNAGITGVLIDRNGSSAPHGCLVIRTLLDVFPLLA